MVDTRSRWLALMLKIADPVLRPLAEGRLHCAFPPVPPEREPYARLEALARTLTGMAPWLENAPGEGEEGSLAEEYRTLARKGLENAVDPHSPDRMNFTEGYGQSLVDAAFLAHAVLRAPNELYGKLPQTAQRNLLHALRATRKFQPYPSNWLFFSAMIETLLFALGEEYEHAPVQRAIDAFEKWYCGDGTYGDGDFFHHDYYNSFVIHPMYTDIVRTFAKEREEYALLAQRVTARAARYAAVLERLVAPDGTYPVMGRSACYRFGAFHALAQAAYEEYLPPQLFYPQVRCALDAAIARTERGGMFDERGYLRVGVCGYQPSLAEHYICTGSLYLCETVFLPLGLSPKHPFWMGADRDYTSKKIWSGTDVPADCAED